jgi:cyanosortase A-associated protein
MSFAKFSRQGLLVALSATAIGVLGYLLVANPPVTRRSATAFQFPKRVPLAEWQLLQSRLLPATKQNNQTTSPGWRYRYQRYTQVLNIDLRYITDPQTSSQDLKHLLRQFTSISPAIIQAAQQRQNPELGYYSLLTDSNTYYLSTCINPQGGSTVTRQQFQLNRRQKDIQLNRLLPWILGQAPLMDHRCLWTLLALPRNQSPPLATEETLEVVGTRWIRWWQDHFPGPLGAAGKS